MKNEKSGYEAGIIDCSDNLLTLHSMHTERVIRSLPPELESKCPSVEKNLRNHVEGVNLSK